MKRGRVLIVLVLVSMLLVPFVSAGMFDWFKDLFNIGDDKDLGGELYSLSGEGSGLIAHYDFEGNANDVSGNGHDGTVVGASWTSAGKSGGGYEFDGNDKITVDLTSEGISGDDGASFSGWFKPTTKAYEEDHHIYYFQFGNYLYQHNSF